MNVALVYTIREIGRSVEVQFNKAPSHALRDVLKEFGFRFDRRTQAWSGSVRYKAALLECCERAKRESERSRKRQEEGNTLCETCAHAAKGCVSPCPWAREFKPVEGWDAVHRPLKLKRGEGCTDSYLVRACPLYRNG